MYISCSLSFLAFIFIRASPSWYPGLALGSDFPVELCWDSMLLGSRLSVYDTSFHGSGSCFASLLSVETEVQSAIQVLRIHGICESPFT